MTTELFHCPYGGNTSGMLVGCPLGFPGCGCMDDVMEESGPGWDEYLRITDDTPPEWRGTPWPPGNGDPDSAL